MSDFLTGLRGELVGAHARHRRAGRARRAARTARAVAPRAALATATLAAVVVAAVVMRTTAPAPAGPPRVLDVLRVGGSPTDATYADGQVWVGDFARRSVVRLQPGGRRVAGRIPVHGRPVAVAAGAGGVWVRTAIGDGGVLRHLGGGGETDIGYGSTLAAGETAVWAADVELGPERLRRIDGVTGRQTAALALPGIRALAAGGDALWAVTGNGTVLRLDADSGHVLHRWPAVAISAGTADPALVADAGGAWVLRVAQGADSQAIRLEGDRITHRIPIPPTARPLLALGAGGMWTIADDRAARRSTAVRLDPEDGRVTARIDLGSRDPTALTPVGDQLWIASSDGSVTIVGG